MATITEQYVTGSGNSSVYTIVSGDATTSDSIDLTDLQYAHPHCYLGIQMFDGAGDQILAGGATGTFTINVETTNSKVSELPTWSTIDAAAPRTINWRGNTTRITVTGATLATLVTWRVVVTMNRS